MPHCPALPYVSTLPSRCAESEFAYLNVPGRRPSAAVFAGFDDLLILTEGKPAYFGPAARLGEYIISIGHACTEGSNPAETMLNLVNRDFTEDDQVDHMIESGLKLVDGCRVTHPEKTPMPNSSSGALLFQQVLALTRKATRQATRVKVEFLARLCAVLMMSLMFAVNYVESREPRQDQVFGRFGLVMWSTTCPPVISIIAVYLTWVDLVVIKREVKDGMYSPIAYVIANTIVQVPLLAVYSLVMILPGLYGVGQVPMASIGAVLLLTFCLSLLLELTAQIYAVVFPHALVGMLAFLGLFFTCFFYNGVMLREDDCPWPFKLFIIINPMKYSNAGVMHAVFSKSTYSGTMPCDLADPLCPRGFYCANSAVTDCYGNTGYQVLTSLSQVYKSINPDNHFGMQVAILLGYAAMSKVVFFLGVLYTSSRFKLPGKP